MCKGLEGVKGVKFRDTEGFKVNEHRTYSPLIPLIPLFLFSFNPLIPLILKSL